ncbi:MAG: hypothetical protein IJB51_07240 [Clostridia bacterium]|nr:hypothetical protein [Clostridia bacterium]
MLHYVNHRLIGGGVSFQIPDGYFIDLVPGIEFDNGVRLLSPDESFSVELRVEEDCEGAVKELTSVLNDLEPVEICSVEPITMNGLSGYHATYRCLRYQFYEAWFDVDKTTALSLAVETQGDIMDIDVGAIVADVDPRVEPK